MKIGFHAAAEKQIEEVADYYDRQLPGLGAEFYTNSVRYWKGHCLWFGRRRALLRMAQGWSTVRMSIFQLCLVLFVRDEHVMKAWQANSGLGHQGGEPGYEIQGLDMARCSYLLFC